MASFPFCGTTRRTGGPYITSGVGIVRDPESGAINVGVYRHQVYGRDEIGVWFIDTHHGAYIYRANEAAGRPTPIVIAIGHRPTLIMGAVSRIPGIGAAGGGGRPPWRAGAAGRSGDLRTCRAGRRRDRPRRRGLALPAPGRSALENGGRLHGGGPKPIIRSKPSRCGAMPSTTTFSEPTGRPGAAALPRMGSIYRAVEEVVPVSGSAPCRHTAACTATSASCKERDAEVEKGGLRRAQHGAET